MRTLQVVSGNEMYVDKQQVLLLYEQVPSGQLDVPTGVVVKAETD